MGSSVRELSSSLDRAFLSRMLRGRTTRVLSLGRLHVRFLSVSFSLALSFSFQGLLETKLTRCFRLSGTRDRRELVAIGCEEGVWIGMKGNSVCEFFPFQVETSFVRRSSLTFLSLHRHSFQQGPPCQERHAVCRSRGVLDVPRSRRSRSSSSFSSFPSSSVEHR